MKFGITTYDGQFPTEKLLLLQQLLSKHGGRFTQNPRIWKSFYENKEYATVSYGFDDVHACNRFNQELLDCMTDVTEIRTDQWYRKLWRRIKFSLKKLKCQNKKKN